jgi:hypothetical protein
VLVPLSLLRQQVTIELYQGSSMTGPIFGEPVVKPCRFEAKRRVVRRVNAGGDIGKDAISTGSVTIRPDVDVPVESKATIADRTYEVLEVLTGEGLTRPSYLELLVG